MRIYLAGPMRGLPDWNRAAFEAAEDRWKAAGHKPFSPHRISVPLGYTTEDENDRGALEHVMAIDFACLYAADAIALLPGWEASRGVTVELALAQFLGLEVYDAVTVERLSIIRAPWKHFYQSVRPANVDVYTARGLARHRKEQEDAPQNAERQHGLQTTGGGDLYGFDPDLGAS